MTFQKYETLNNFPRNFITIFPSYELNKGDVFVGIRKEKLGTDDYSIIDEKGRPHYFTGCIIEEEINEL